ncbi:MAG: MaoC family dehydratase N-terminal domain-containing protein [Alphaproteobacteria bacterium]|nr:MaoC family dehydratase N-terminal domain-containing protein [Alphaproteobacteria bacterium]
MPIDYDDMMQSGAECLSASYDEKDVMLYALGVGFGRDPLDPNELAFVYENVEGGLKVPPTFASVIARGEAPPERQRMPQKSQINFMLVVDGERRITMHKKLPPRCEVLADERYLDILDKGEGKGAVLIQERVVREKASGEKLFTIVSSIFARGDGGFGGKAQGGPPLHEIPQRAPDLVKECDTRSDQALLYALSGDRNPLHRDPKIAQLVGFPRPILHGLCSYGTACRAILSTVAQYAPERITQFDVRFSKPVFPGETLAVEIWTDGGAISFRALVKERPGTVVLNNGLCILG